MITVAPTNPLLSPFSFADSLQPSLEKDSYCRSRPEFLRGITGIKHVVAELIQEVEEEQCQQEWATKQCAHFADLQEHFGLASAGAIGQTALLVALAASCVLSIVLSRYLHLQPLVAIPLCLVTSLSLVGCGAFVLTKSMLRIVHLVDPKTMAPYSKGTKCWHGCLAALTGWALPIMALLAELRVWNQLRDNGKEDVKTIQQMFKVRVRQREMLWASKVQQRYQAVTNRLPLEVNQLPIWNDFYESGQAHLIALGDKPMDARYAELRDIARELHQCVHYLFPHIRRSCRKPHDSVTQGFDCFALPDDHLI